MVHEWSGIITLSNVIEGVLSHHALDNLGHLRHFGNIITLNDKADNYDFVSLTIQ